MLMMLPLSVGMECVLGVIAPMTPNGVYSSSVMPWSPLQAVGLQPLDAGHELDESCSFSILWSSRPILVSSSSMRPHALGVGLGQRLDDLDDLARGRRRPSRCSCRKASCAAAQASFGVLEHAELAAQAGAAWLCRRWHNRRPRRLRRGRGWRGRPAVGDRRRRSGPALRRRRRGSRFR